MGRPEEAIDEQLKLWRWFHDNEDMGLDYARRLFSSHDSQDPKLREFRGGATDTAAARGIREVILGITGYAPTYVVSPEMSYVINVASQQLFESENWPIPHPSDILTRRGFVIGDFYGYDVGNNNEKFRYDGFMWDTYQDVTFTDRIDGEVMTGKGLTMLSLIREEETGILIPFHLTGWAYDIPWRMDEDETAAADPGNVTMSAAWHRCNVHAFMHFIQSKVSLVKSSRPARRRWERIGPPSPVYGSVRVVRLRRSAQTGTFDPGASDEEVSREWSHRWVVSGHWRNQWYPSEGRHKLIWVDPYVKGPDHLPLIPKDTFYSVER